MNVIIGEQGYKSRTLGSVFLPVLVQLVDNNSVDWSADEMDPGSNLLLLMLSLIMFKKIL